MFPNGFKHTNGERLQRTQDSNVQTEKCFNGFNESSYGSYINLIYLWTEISGDRLNVRNSTARLLPLTKHHGRHSQHSTEMPDTYREIRNGHIFHRVQISNGFNSNFTNGHISNIYKYRKQLNSES